MVGDVGEHGRTSRGATDVQNPSLAASSCHISKSGNEMAEQTLAAAPWHAGSGAAMGWGEVAG